MVLFSPSLLSPLKFILFLQDNYLHTSLVLQYNINIYLLFQQHDAPAGLDGADFSVFVHGDHQQAIHHPLLPLTGVHQQIRPAEGTQSAEDNVHNGTAEL